MLDIHEFMPIFKTLDHFSIVKNIDALYHKVVLFITNLEDLYEHIKKNRAKQN